MYALNSDNDLYTWGIQTLPTSSASWNFSTVTVAYSSPVQIANIKITEMTYGSTVANFLKSNV
jgi:hypothetical protein